MKGDHRNGPGVAGSVLLIAVLCLSPAASANDYYSWIDGNGTMVMTDDPSRVPPPTVRSQIQVHRFEPSTPGDPGRPEEEPAPREEPTQIMPVDPVNLDLPLVRLEDPETNVRGQYVWVPLVSPLFVRGNMVNGFWWHPGSTSPVEAFKHFLAQHYREQRPQWAPGVGVPYPYAPPARGASGNTVYDQVVRERQALEESVRLRHFPGSPAPDRQVTRGGGGGRHSIRSR